MTEFFTIDYSLSIAIAKPITFEMGRAWYLNPIAMFEGDATAPVKLAIVKSPDGILPAQNATATDELDTFKRLAPDGLGGTRWALPLEGGTLSLTSGTDHLQSVLLNEGLWCVTYMCRLGEAAGRMGTCWLLNGAILVQSEFVINTSGAGTFADISTSAFTVSGSGATKRITSARNIGASAPTEERIMAARVG